MRSSPGTHVWLAVIVLTSLVLALVPTGVEDYFLRGNSSNLHQLAHHPVRALIGSAFWIEDPAGIVLYAALFELLHAPVERWLGTAKWLFAVAAAHVTATLVSQQVVLAAIRLHDVPRSMAHVVDIGVSYGLAASAGVLAHRLARPWRWFHLAGVTAFFAVPLVTDRTYTDLGHAIALAVGVACRPLTRGKPVAHEQRPGAH
ncbi:rhomboid-like protein [Streptomyces sp. NPDC057242]|uniref:rhomboid-like protein n=1 Tax=unclassified Streptomyces TaxID=2593676 RepID=UPI003635F909